MMPWSGLSAAELTGVAVTVGELALVTVKMNGVDLSHCQVLAE